MITLLLFLMFLTLSLEYVNIYDFILLNFLFFGSMSGSNCYYLTCMQISQEAGQMVLMPCEKLNWTMIGSIIGYFMVLRSCKWFTCKVFQGMGNFFLPWKTLFWHVYVKIKDLRANNLSVNHYFWYLLRVRFWES